MKYILFLNDLELISKKELKKLLVKAGCHLKPIWFNNSTDVYKISRDVEIIVTREHKVEKKLLKDFPNLKTLSLAFTGYDEANVEFFISKGLMVYNVPDYAASSVAELNIGLTLSLLRKILMADKAIRKRESEWSATFYPGSELANKIVGIIGTGRIGIKTAELFHAFNCRVLGYSKRINENFLKAGGKYKTKDKLISESDIIILSLPLNNGTIHFINSGEFQLMKHGAILINASRSELIEEQALLEALRKKKIWAGLDVTKSTEKIGKKLSEMENVVLTPHIGYKTKEALKRLSETAIENVGYSLKGIKTNCLNYKKNN